MPHALLKWIGAALFVLASLNVATIQAADVTRIRLLLEADIFPDEERFSEAEKLCREGLETQPGDSELTLLLVEALIGQKRLGEVPGVLTAAIDVHPRDTELILKRAIAYSSLEETQELLKDCRRLDQLGEGRGLTLAVEVFEAQGQPLLAVKCYTQLLSTFPNAEDRADWHFSRAKLFTELRMFDWAEFDVRTSLEAEWDPLKALLLGEILALQKRWEEAEATLQQVFERVDADRHIIAELRRLRVLVNMGELDKAALFFQQYDEKYAGTEKLARANEIRKLQADRQKAIEDQILAAKKQNRPSGFETAEESAAERARMQELKSSTKPDDISELKRLFIRHAQFGMESEELEYAETMLRLLDEGEGQKKFELTDAESARKATVEAWVLIQKDSYPAAFAKAHLAATQLDRGFGDAWRMMGLAAYMMDNNADAVGHVSKAIELDPLNLMAHGLRGLIHTDLRNYDQAAKDLVTASELDPHNRWLAGVRAHFFRAVEDGTNLARNHCQANPGLTLDRCDLLLELDQSELAAQDAMEYFQKADESEKPRIAALIANAGYSWFTQTIQYETGGPSAEQLLNISLQAWEMNPGDGQFAAYIADALRFQGRYSLSAMWTERALQASPDSATLLYQLASVKLAEGDLASAKASLARMKEANYKDDDSVGLRNEMETVVALAEDLSTTLERIKFRTATGTALQQLLGRPKDTARVFDQVHAVELDKVYTRMRPQAAGVPSPDQDTILRLSWISTTDLRTQDPTLFDFDEQLAAMAPRLKDAHFWFTLKYTPKDEILGKSFAYFVKLDDGWKVFPEPWSLD